MIYSMTAYGNKSFHNEYGTLSIEVRSVNHRFLELSLKLSEECKVFETEIRQRLTASLARGKVECKMQWSPQIPSDIHYHFDNEKLIALCDSLKKIKTQCPESTWPSLDALLLFPGIISNPDNQENTAAFKNLQEFILESLNSVLEDVEIVRLGEGKRIEMLLLDRSQECSHLVQQLLSITDSLTQHYQERIKGRLKEFATEINDERLLQEATVYALKADVKEELDRLIIHLQSLADIIAQGGSVGKKLDFLLQELNREANTLASKSSDIGITQSALKLKLLIEQMREQIQNLV
ncbi:MAG: YicC/YloC family endoribonuclease [Pseudomonadota bacterium]